MSYGSPTARIAVLVPCRDEEATVAGVVQAFQSSLPEASVYVYDNASTDGTAAAAAAAGAIVRSCPPPGKGEVVRRMFADVEADVYVTVDGDGTYDPSVARRMVDGVLIDGNDVVIARRVPVGNAAYRPAHAFGNRVLNALIGLLFGVRVPDLLSGYQAMSRRFVRSLPVMSHGFEIETEIAVHALELRAPIAEVPAPYRARPDGSTSKLGTWRDGLRILRTMERLLRHSRPLLFFGAVGVVLAAIAVALGVPIVATFVHTHKVPRFPTAVLATGLSLLAALNVGVGVILDVVSRSRREAKLLAYLAIRGPRAECDECDTAGTGLLEERAGRT